MKKVLLGIDLGTSSIKCSLFGLDGTALYTSSTSYATVKGAPGELEINPSDIFSSLVKNLKDLVGKNSGKYRIVAVGLCAVMIMPVFLDKYKKIARPIIHWFDNRPYKQYEKLKENKKDRMIAELSGSLLTAEGTINSLLWVKENEPSVYSRIDRFFQLKDYARFKLTGNILTDYGDASGTQLFDSMNWRWNSGLISELGLKKDMFCDALRPTDISGTITREISSLTGLEEGIPVAVGSGDGITTIFGLGIHEEGQTGITVGSAGVIASPSKKYPRDKKMRNYIFCHPFGDRWFSLMATASTGEVFKWYKENILKNDDTSLNELEKESRDYSTPGANGLSFLPYILGARSPHSNPRASGALFGLRHHHQRADITRAILEGLSFELLDIIEAQRDIFQEYKKELGQFKLSGGILKGSIWKNILADILQKDLVLTRSDELGCLGAAMYASVAAGIYKDLDQAVDNMVHDTGNIRCNQKNFTIYDKKYSIFKSAYKLFENNLDDLAP